MLAITTPFPQFFDLSGAPLNAGLIYVGVANLDPVSNPLMVFWDAAGTIPAPQPVKTINGVPSRAGSPALLYVPDGAYSMLVKNKAGRQVFYAADASAYSNSAAIRAQFNNLGSAASGNGASLIAWSQSVAGSTVRTVREKLLDQVSAFDVMASSQVIAVQAGARSFDATSGVQTAIAGTDGRSLLLPGGSYPITQVYVSGQNRLIKFEGAELFANATTAHDCLLNFSGIQQNLRDVYLNGNFSTLYTSALQWYNASSSSQFNRFDGLEIRYTKIGLNYGPLLPGVSTDFAQSENTISGFRTRGVERPIVMNHGNGFLFLENPMLVAHDEEWPAGQFDYTANRAFDVRAGTLVINGGEVQNTRSAISSVCAYINGGVVHMNGVITEVSTPFFVSGQLFINGGQILNVESTTDQFYIPVMAQADTRIRVQGTKIFRNGGVGAFSNRSLVANAGSNPTIDITFENCEIYEWAPQNLVQANHRSVRFINCKYIPTNSVEPVVGIFKLDTGAPDLLDRPSIDTKGLTTDGWFIQNVYGTPTLGLSADVPNGSFKNSLELTSPGVCWASSGNPASLATLKQTAFRVGDYDKFMLEGWFRIAVGSQGAVGLALFDSAGVYAGPIDMIDQNRGLTSAWQYLRFVGLVPADASGVYAAPGIRGQLSTIRVCGMKVRRADWNAV